MKISAAVSLLILVAAALIGWTGQRGELAKAEAEHARLISEAAALGILSIDPDDPEKELRVTKRGRADVRADKLAEAHEVAREVIAFAIEMKRLEESGKAQDEAMQERTLALIDRMLSLDGGQLETVIADFRASKEVDGDIRNGILSFAILALAEEHPETALKLFTEGGDDLLRESVGKYQLSAALAKFAEQDPNAALEWVRVNSGKHPDLVTDDVKNGLVRGAAKNDMKLAFGLITELGIKDASDALSEIADSVEDMKERKEFLGLLRDFSKKEAGSSGSGALSYLAPGIAKEGFAAGSRWIAENKLSPAEIAVLAGNIAMNAKGSEKGQWIEWMGDGLSGKERETKIETSVQQWTQKDHRAAGEWLAGLPEGPAKVPAVASFARTVADYDPQIASQWALTMPPGEKRKETLREIYQRWPKDDVAGNAAREAFAREHGIAVESAITLPHSEKFNALRKEAEQLRTRENPAD